MAQYPVPPKGGRMPNRLGTPTETETQAAAPSVDLTAMFRGDQQEAPAAPVAEPTPEVVPEKQQKETGKKQKPTDTKKPKRPSKKAEEEDSEDFADKDKYSIYLPPKLSMALRMVYISTRKKYSHITEVALTDMLFNRYQCHNPKCTARFSISEGDHTPICCPVCGEKKFSPLRMDLFD